MSVYGIGNINEILTNNTYPGRGIIIGKSADGTKAVFAYFIMGRSENSRNRVFVKKDHDVTIYPFDSSKVEDPSLIIYSPVRVFENKVIVTNGDQTDTVYDYLADGKSFEEALESRCFEPDAPNFTPRISGILDFDKGFSYKMSILKSADENGSACNRFTYSYSPLSGLGHFIHTYEKDGSPVIPTFNGEPERVAINDSIDCFTDTIWSSLNENNKISLYVRFTNLSDGSYEDRLINKNK